MLSAPPAVAWGHLYTLLRVAGGAAVPAGAQVDGVPMGDLFALANAIAAMVGGAVTIEDPQSYVLAYSSADLPIDEARREVILGRRVPERFLRRLREAGVFKRLQTTDDVVAYVDQEEDVLPRLAVGIRAGGELLGSIWVADSTESLGARRQGRSSGGGADGRPAPHPAPQLGRSRAPAAWRAGSHVLEGDVHPDAAALLGLDAGTAVTVVALRVDDPDDPSRSSADAVARIERVVGLVALYFESFQRHVAQVTIGPTIYVMIPETLRRRAGPAAPADRRPHRTSPSDRAHAHRVGGRLDRAVDRRDELVAARGRPGDPRPRGSPDRSIAPIEEVRAETIMLALRDHALGDAYLRAGPVEALRQHDEQKGTSYVETLEAYFSAFGYVPLAAKTIFVHPNTFRYRLRRLTEISGLTSTTRSNDWSPSCSCGSSSTARRPAPASTTRPAPRTRNRQTRSPQFIGSHKVRGARPSDSGDMASDRRTLQEWVTEAAERLDVPGVAVGVYHDGEEHYAFHGVTSVENPLPVDEDTLFQFGSTGKTFTATAIMRLVDQGRVDLDATVRTYLPELTLKDEERRPATSPCCSCSTTPPAGPATCSTTPATATTRSPATSS